MASAVQRLRQRKIVEWAIAYVAAAWLLLELLGFVAENFGWPAGIVRGATVFLGIGFFVTLVLAWYHGEKGHQHATGLELLIIAGLLFVAGAGAAYVSRDSAPEESETGAPPTLAIDPRSIAVLPFENRSAEGENAAFFAEGMHDDILTTLAKIGSLKVISRTSAMKYRETERTIPEIAIELGVATVLEGGVQRAGDRVRLNVQLIDAATDRHIWAETYDEELTTANIFSIHSDIARKIAAALQATLAPEVEERIEVRPTESLEAYDLYTRGRYLASRSRTRRDMESAADLYRKAIAADPAYARAQVDLAGTYLVLWGQGSLAADEALPQARAAVERALELDEPLAEAHAALGSVLVGELRFEDAEREFERALELNHGSADVHLQYGQLLLELAQNAEAVRQARQAVELDPLSIANRLFLAASLMFARDNDASIIESLRILELEPENSVAHYVLALGFTLAGRHEEGLAAIRRSIELDPEDLLGPPLLAWVYARAGQREEALKTLERVEEQGPILREIAIVHGELGDMDRAFAYLDRAFADDPGNLSYLKADPTADSLRDDPRYAELLKKLGLE
jgi:TolB-like protein/tetratricopeptide (TPR) repeat protein